MYARAHKIRATNRPRGYSSFPGNRSRTRSKVSSKSPCHRIHMHAHAIYNHRRRGRARPCHRTRHFTVSVYTTRILTNYALIHLRINVRSERVYVSFEFPLSVRACVWGLCRRGLATFTGRPTCVRHTRAPFIQLRHTTRYTVPKHVIHVQRWPSRPIPGVLGCNVCMYYRQK